MDYQENTENRVKERESRSCIDINTNLEHFAIISYKIPIERIQHLIPKPFKLWTYVENEKEYALISAVPFKDKDFSFYRISRFPSFNFFQTNFRAYIIDERDNSYSAWFFGTTLGSMTVIIPKKIWNMPWEYAKYKCSFKQNKEHYIEYKMDFKSKFGDGNIDIESTGNRVKLLSGFKNMAEQVHILTHPIIGYYDLKNGEIGTYEIWHPEIELKEATFNHLYFELFEKLGLLNKSEMMNPHSVLITSKVEFDILLPPRKITTE
jgi:hypothetical protein